MDKSFDENLIIATTKVIPRIFDTRKKIEIY